MAAKKAPAAVSHAAAGKPASRASGILGAVEQGSKPAQIETPAVAPAVPEKNEAEQSYDRILESAKKFVAERTQEQVEQKPVTPVIPAAEKPATVTPEVTAPALPQALLQRARELGWMDDETTAIGDLASVERAVSTAERMALRALRNSAVRHEADRQATPAQQPPQKPAMPSLWKNEQEKADFDPRFVELVERMQGSLHSHYENTIQSLQAQLQRQGEYLQAQAAEQGRSQMDQICDKLSDHGYGDVFGKGRSPAGSMWAENKGKLATLLGNELRTYQQAGVTLDLEEAAGIIAKRLFGGRESKPAAPAEEVITPQTQFSQPRRPTQTNRPTQREAPRPVGREAAVAGARAWWEANGSPLLDIHGES